MTTMQDVRSPAIKVQTEEMTEKHSKNLSGYLDSVLQGGDSREYHFTNIVLYADLTPPEVTAMNKKAEGKDLSESEQKTCEEAAKKVNTPPSYEDVQGTWRNC